MMMAGSFTRMARLAAAQLAANSRASRSRSSHSTKRYSAATDRLRDAMSGMNARLEKMPSGVSV